VSIFASARREPRGPKPKDGEALGTSTAWRGGPRRPFVLSVTPWLPSHDARYAGHKFYFEYLKVLAQRFQVVVVAPDGEENRSLAARAEEWETVLVGALARREGPLRELSALWLQGRGDPVPDISSVLRARRQRPDVVELHWSPVMTLAPVIKKLLPGTFVAAVEHDRYSATRRWSKLAHLRWRARVRDSIAGATIALQERALVRSCDLVAAFKSADLEFARKSGAMTVVLDPWVEEGGSRELSSATQDVLFVGAFNRAENISGAEWLISQVWPEVRRQHPRARLVLAGANPTGRLKQSTDGSMLITGFVDDLAPYYRAAHCCVAPIFGGGGLRFKVVQAMCSGVPLVATPEALVGMEDLPREHLAGATADPRQFGRAICRVLSNSQEAERRASALKVWADGRFSFRAKVERMIWHYERAARARQDGAAGAGQLRPNGVARGDKA